MQNPNSNGQTWTSVPVLFSLPNVQPIIAAASTGATKNGQGSADATQSPVPHFEDEATVGEHDPAIAITTVGINPTRYDSSSIVVSPSVPLGAKADSWLSKLTSQLTNITIIVLLLAVVGLAFRNYQQGLAKKESSLEVAILESPELVPSPSPSLPSPSLPSPSLPSPIIANQPPASPTLASQLPASPTLASPGLVPAPTAPEAVESAVRTVQAPALVPLVESPAPLMETAATASEKPGAPLLLQPAKGNDPERVAEKSPGDLPRTVSTGPYGTSSQQPFSLTSSQSPQSSLPSVTTRSSSAAPGRQPARPEAIETDTPSLNTRDIILLRNGQRRTDPGVSDPQLPSVESAPRLGGARSGPMNDTGLPKMTGQSYPPIQPQYEPINIPKNDSISTRNRNSFEGNAVPSSRIQQPPNQRPYVPLSPVLPNPNETLGPPSGTIPSGNPPSGNS